MRNQRGQFAKDFRKQFFRGVAGFVILMWLTVGVQWIDERIQSAITHEITVERAQAQEVYGPFEWKSEVYGLLKDFGIDTSIAKAVITCESNHNPAAVGDSGKSLGIWQISTLHHEITPDCAFDPVCSTYAAIRIIKSGRGWSSWTCYRNLYQ